MVVQLTNKVALITGSSAGIGAATAILFSSLGAKVVIVGRNREKCNTVAQKCVESSPSNDQPLIIQADFEKEEDVQRTLDETIKAFNRLDILVNNAGLPNRSPFREDGYLQDYDRVMQVNVRSVIQLTHLARPYLAQTKGSVVNISSIAALRPGAPYWSYCISKAALDMVTKTLAAELAPEVRVNSVNPGPVRTEFLREHENATLLWNFMEKSMPLKRVGVPEDIANLVAFLASDAAQNMTGSIVVSDSGSMIVHPSPIPSKKE